MAIPLPCRATDTLLRLFVKHLFQRSLNTLSAAGIFKRISTEPVAQCHGSNATYIVCHNFFSSVKSGERSSSARDCQLSAVSVDLQFGAELCDLTQ